MGHEHVQRYGADEPAFRAIRERRPGRSSYLLDTDDTIHSGIPAAFKLIREDPSRGDSIRYDCELAKSQGIRPVMIREDGWDLELTRRFEVLREEVGWSSVAKPKRSRAGSGERDESDGREPTTSRGRIRVHG